MIRILIPFFLKKAPVAASANAAEIFFFSVSDESVVFSVEPAFSASTVSSVRPAFVAEPSD